MKGKKEEDDSGCGCFVLFAAYILIFSMAAFGLGSNCAREREREKAIEAGAAEWRIDPKTGERTFHYLTKASP